MKSPASISDLPKIPAVYAFYGGTGRSRHVAYVGIGKSLRGRVEQHLIRQDSSVATGTSAASLNPENVTEVCWWEDKSFRKQENREAAELVAFEVLDPALRSRGAATDRAKEVYADAGFRERMETKFRGEPTGRLELPNLGDALERIVKLEERVTALEGVVKKKIP